MSNICKSIPRIDTEDLKIALNAIRARLVSLSLIEKLQLLEETIVKNDYERIFVKFVMAEFLLSEMRAKFSLVFLKELVEEVEFLGLKNLIPDFYILILNQYYLQLKQTGNVELISNICQKISTVSPVKACLLNSEGEDYA